MPGPRVLDTEEITRQLAELPGWRFAAGAIHASYEAPDFPAAVRLVGEIGDAAESMNHHPDVDLRWRTVRLACSTHSAGGVTQLDIELAHRVNVAAGAAGAKTGTPPPRKWELALDAADPAAVLPFWREALGYVEVTLPDGTVELQDPAGSGAALWFQRAAAAQSTRGSFHVDVYREGEAAAALRDRLLELGGTLVSEEFAPHWWVMADAEGNVACVCTS